MTRDQKEKYFWNYILYSIDNEPKLYHVYWLIFVNVLLLQFVVIFFFINSSSNSPEITIIMFLVMSRYMKTLFYSDIDIGHIDSR